jgi:hypothetical protein
VRLSAIKKYVEDLVAASGGGGGGGGGSTQLLMFGQLRAVVPPGYKFIITLDEASPGETDPVFGNAIETPITDGVPDYTRSIATLAPSAFVQTQSFSSFPTESVEVRIPVRGTYNSGESGSGTLKLREPDFGAFHTVDEIAFGVNP